MALFVIHGDSDFSSLLLQSPLFKEQTSNQRNTKIYPLSIKSINFSSMSQRFKQAVFVENDGSTLYNNMVDRDQNELIILNQ